MIDSKQIGKNIRALRKSKNLTTTELANKVNVSQSYISQFELGQAIPSILMLDKILNALDTDLQTFFSCDSHEHSAEMINLIENTKALSPKARKKLNEFLYHVVNNE